MTSIGKAGKIVSAAWKLNKDKPLAEEVFASEDNKTRYVVRLEAPAAEDEAGKEAAKKTREQLRDTVANMRRVAAWQAFVRKLREQAEKEGEIERNEAWTQILSAERQRYLDTLKRSASQANPAGGSPINLQLNGKPIQFDAPPADAPPADAPAPAPADEPAE